MVKIFTIAFLLTISSITNAQKLPLKLITEKLTQGQKITAFDFGFREYTVRKNGDTINFYTYQKNDKITPTSVYLYLPGTNAENIYSYHKEKNGSFWFNSLTSFDFSFLPENYLFIIVAKPGFGFFGNGDSDTIPKIYWNKTSLNDRVMRANTALDYILKNVIKKPKNVAVFGYSEGFYVGSKLATLNKKITHLGIGGGGGYTDFYDFILFNQKALLKSEIANDTAIKSNQEIISSLKQIMSNPESVEMIYGYTYKRWSSFAVPSIQNLVKLKIPIYQVHASNDESTPIESAYIIPTEFARLNKNNLTFTVYKNSNHSLIETTKDGEEINHWNEMINDFFKWISLN